jgi:hypothetical protein
MSMRSRILAQVVAVTALGALTACSNSSDPAGDVATGPATGDAAKIQAADGDRFTPKTLQLPAGDKVTIQITDERFKAGVALLAGWDGVSLLGGRGRPRSKEQGRGAGSPAAQLAP